MASLEDAFGEDFAKEMAAKNYDYLQVKASTIPVAPLTTEEQVKYDKTISDQFTYANTSVFNFGDNIKIGKRCYESFPCYHLYNGQLLSAREMYELLQNAGFIQEIDNMLYNNYTAEQNNFIRHIVGQMNSLKKLQLELDLQKKHF